MGSEIMDNKCEAIDQRGDWFQKFNDDDYDFEIQISNRNQTISITAERVNKFPEKIDEGFEMLKEEINQILG